MLRFLCVFFLTVAIFLSIFSWLSVPVKSIAWKHSSPIWPIMCRVMIARSCRVTVHVVWPFLAYSTLAKFLFGFGRSRHRCSSRPLTSESNETSLGLSAQSALIRDVRNIFFILAWIRFVTSFVLFGLNEQFSFLETEIDKIYSAHP